MEFEAQYKMIIESLNVLNSSFEQKQIYPNYSDIPDEVISDFENSFLLLPQLIENKMFTYDAIAAILRIYNWMQWCLRNTDLDNFSSEEWNKVRQLAKDALELL